MFTLNTPTGRYWRKNETWITNADSDSVNPKPTSVTGGPGKLLKCPEYLVMGACEDSPRPTGRLPNELFGGGRLLAKGCLNYMTTSLGWLGVY
jgi:hypothetical protein